MGRPVTQSVGSLGLGRASYYRWRRRTLRPSSRSAPHPRGLTPDELASIDQLKAQQPSLRHRQLQGVLQAQGLYISASRVYQRLKCQGWSQAYARRPAPWKEPRYAVWRRNLLWGSDWTRLQIAGLRWYLLTLIDFFSRLLVAHQVVPSVHAGEVKALYQEGLWAQGLPLHAPSKPELRVDRGSPNTSGVTQEFFQTLGAALSFARVRRPTDNAITERFYGTIKQEEVYLVGNYPDVVSARQELGRYIQHYNTARPHQALWNFTPQVVHDLNDKTELLRRLQQLKQDTLERRRRYWVTRQEGDSINSPLLSQSEKT